MLIYLLVRILTRIIRHSDWPIADDKVGVQIRQLLREYITLEQFQKKVEYITPTI